MGILNGLKVVGKIAGRVFAIGIISSMNQQLVSTNRTMMNDLNGQVGRGYEFYAKPKIQRGMKIIRGGKKDE